MALAQNRSVDAVERYKHFFLVCATWLVKKEREGCGIPVCRSENLRLPERTMLLLTNKDTLMGDVLQAGRRFIFTRLKQWANNGPYLTPSRKRRTVQQTLPLSGLGTPTTVLMKWHPLSALQPSAWTDFLSHLPLQWRDLIWWSVPPALYVSGFTLFSKQSPALSLAWPDWKEMEKKDIGPTLAPYFLYAHP